MYREIFSQSQLELLSLVSQFRREFYLVGGTAIALHIGHRRSIDFGLFKNNRLRIKRIIDKIEGNSYDFRITRRVDDQLNIVINGVKFTFFEYPYDIEVNKNFEKIIKLPDLLQLAAMKAFALGRRSKWKDYVDLYFIINNFYSVPEIANKANSIYKSLFSEKLFRAQLCYFDDIDYSEEVDFIIENPPGKSEIKSFLCNVALDAG